MIVPKLLDFGLAGSAKVSRLTDSGHTVGTPGYMPPEQAYGLDHIDHRVDLYAVGCTFFELLTGRPPFVDGDVMYHHLHTPPPAPSSFRPGLPAELDALILACLAKDVAERVATADVIREGLRRLPLG